MSHHPLRGWEDLTGRTEMGGIWEVTKLCVGGQKVWHSCVATGIASTGIEKVEPWTVQAAPTSVLRHMMGELGTQDKDKEKQMVLSRLWASGQWHVKNFGKWGKLSGFWSKYHDISYCLCIVIDEFWHVKLWQLKIIAPSCHFCHRLSEKKYDCD